MKQKSTIGIRRSLSNLAFMLRYAVKYTPGYVAAVCLFEAFAAAEVFMEFTYTTKYLLEVLEMGGTWRQAVSYMLFITFLVVLKIIAAGFLEQSLVPRAAEKLRKRLRMDLYQKAVELDLGRYDNPEYYNEFVWSINEASGRMDKILADLRRFVNSATAVVVNGIFFLTLDRVGLLFVVGSLLVTLVLHSHLGKLNFSRDLELKPLERKRDYFNRIFYLNDYAKEIRLNPVGDMLKESFAESNGAVFPVLKKYGKRQTAVAAAGTFFSNNLLLDVAYIGYLLYQTIFRNAFTFGSMIGLYQASSSLQNSMNRIAQLAPAFLQHSFYVEKIRTFLSFESQMADGSLPLKTEDFSSLTLKHVSFGYEGHPETLHDVSLKIQKGEKIAIVGYNGAGKTTLIKLLLRLYDVTGGSIQVNDTDIRRIKKSDYCRLFSSVFQDYKIFGATVADNVKMEPASQEDAPAVKEALEESGFHECLSSLEQGVWTELTKEFDDHGVNLSGGESQKVAIARTFYRPTPVIILDEPSSALDPISEYRLNQAMLRSAKDRTVIFISHRLSSTVLADRIYMLENGRIIEEGSHGELMARGGKYAEMFRLQSSQYQLDL